jgi:glycosyltransferase involved in cell wall biosynthesis
MIALLGKRDHPTDALRDYCAHLAVALARRNVSLRAVDFEWDRAGWPRAFAQLRRQSRDWRGEWVIVHYTALGWSLRGFPWRFLRVLRTLHRAGARVAVVFHDSMPAAGRRWRDRIRAAAQRHVMRRGYAFADFSIFALPLEQVHWLPRPATKAAFIPIGSNILPLDDERSDGPSHSDGSAFGSPAHLGGEILRRIAVFGVTGSGRASREAHDIAAVVRLAGQRVGPISLLVMGRGAEAARPALNAALAGSGVDAEIFGILPATEIALKLSTCDAMLFVRGELSPQRGSALAAVTCALPLVGYRGPHTVFPITEAGIELAPLDDRSALAEALCRVLIDDTHRLALRQKSQCAYAQYFSWEVIAGGFIEALSL